MFKEYRYPSANQTDTVYGLVCYPNSPIRGYIQIIHDRYDHISRYCDLMKQLANDGYLSFGCDLLGHGKTAASLGVIEVNHSWQLIEDIHQLFLYVFNDFKKIPATIAVNQSDKKGSQTVTHAVEPILHGMLGIGFGCVLARNYMMKYKDVNALILCSDEGFPAHPRRSAMACRKAMKEKGKNSYASELKALLEENKQIYLEGEKDTHAYRSSSRQELRKINNDSACNFEYTVQAYTELLNQQMLIDLETWTAAFPKYLPLYIMAGMLDPISNYTKNIDSMLIKLKASSAQNIFYKYYANSRHDLFFDKDSSAAIKDLLLFLNNCVRAQREPFERLKKLNSN